MDANDFKRRFLPYHQKLYRTAFRLMGNAQDAEDMVQEVYLKLWKKREELPPDIGNTEAYCVTLTKNLCLDALRASRPEEDNRPPEELGIAHESDPLREMTAKDEANQVKRIIESLPRQQRQVIVMRDVNECSMEEIEEATGLSPGNIRVLLSRTRKKIREQFNAIRNYECR